MKRRNNFLKYIIFCASLLLIFCTGSIVCDSMGTKTDISASAWSSQVSDGDKPTQSGGTYYISTPHQLAAMAKFLGDSLPANGSYALTTNVNMAGFDWTPPSEFRGSFNGNGCVIENINVVSGNNSGLFGQTSGATIINVSLSNCKVNGTNAGAIVGYMNSGSIRNCIVTDCYIYGSYAGGAIGRANIIGFSSPIKFVNTYAKDSNFRVDGINYAGGIVGLLEGSSIDNIAITNCQNSMEVKNQSYSAYSGGIVGRCISGAIITQCGNTAKISAGTINSNVSYAGGIAGKCDSEISNSYNIGESVLSHARENRHETLLDMEDFQYPQVYGTNFTVTNKDSKVSTRYTLGLHTIFGKGSASTTITSTGQTSYMPSQTRTTIEMSAYAGGIAGYAKRVSSCFVGDNTSVLGGRIENRDFFFVTLCYTQVTTELLTMYNEVVDRTYVLTTNYISDVLYSQITGNSDATLMASYSTQKYPQHFDVNLKVEIYEKKETAFNKSIRSPFYLFISSPYFGPMVTSFEQKLDSHGNTAYFNFPNEAAVVYQKTPPYFPVPFSGFQGVSLRFNYTRMSTTTSSLNYIFSTNYRQIQVLRTPATVSQGIPSGYLQTGTLKGFSGLNASIWRCDGSRNGGYPYLVSNYWQN